jgi:glutamate racemase
MKPTSQRPIGIFDSGLGGLTVVRQIHRALPYEDLVYLGDTARVPYGSKSPATVIRFACEDTRFLLLQQVKAVVVACNTASAWALPSLQARFDLPVFGVIQPGAQAALQASASLRIGVIGTNATVRSQAYQKAILKQQPRARVFSTPCPLLVPLVEEGRIHHPATRLILQEYLQPLLRRRIDTLILGCTHYPLLKSEIQRAAGPGLHLVDSAQSCAADVRTKLGALNLLARQRQRHGVIQPFVTDEVERFDSFARRFLGRAAAQPCKVDLPPTTALILQQKIFDTAQLDDEL